MFIIRRTLESRIANSFGKKKILLIMGTRRVGKTVLTDQLANAYNEKTLKLYAEDFDTQELLKNRSIVNFKRITEGYKLLIIDEAQVIPEIGQILKLMIDHIPDLTIIATGSSSFDLSNKVGDPLTGRSIQFQLYPLSQAELATNETGIESLQNLEERLILGSYPELIHLSNFEDKTAYLSQLVQSYLMKDILAYEGIRQSDKIMKLLRLIALQAGAEVSYNELARQLGISKDTVENYLDLLSKVFIIYRLPAYSSNMRKEVSKSSKWFFFDNGIRNAIINDFRWLALRNDTGSLWENYLISERIKKNSYEGKYVQYFFWRNYNQQEIDLLEIENGEIRTFEFKYTSTGKAKLPAAFTTSYPNASFEVITRNNYLDWIVS